MSTLPRPAGTRISVHCTDVKPLWLSVQSTVKDVEQRDHRQPPLALSNTVRRGWREGALYNIIQEAPLQPGQLISSFLNGPTRTLEATQEKALHGPGSRL